MRHLCTFTGYSTRLVARVLLLCLLLSQGAGFASPLIAPGSLQIICSTGGAMRFARLAVDEAPTQVKAIDCPFCLSALAAPTAHPTPLSLLQFTYSSPARVVTLPLHAATPERQTARAPPTAA